MEQDKVLSLIHLFLYCILFTEDCFVYVKEDLYLACLNLNHQKCKKWKDVEIC